MFNTNIKKDKTLIVLPYIGSKARLIDLVKENVPKNVSVYVEPFAGGFSFGLNLIKFGVIDLGKTKVIVNDLDKEVYEFWSCVRDNAWTLIEEIDNLCNFISNSMVYDCIEDKHLYRYTMEKFCTDKYKRSATFYMCKKLNRGGSSKSLKKCVEYLDKYGYNDPLLEGSALIENIKTYNLGFESLMSKSKYTGENSFWYLDPPYYGYANHDFYGVCETEEFNHVLLKDKLSSKDFNGKFILSYNDCEYIRNLYKDFNIYPIKLYSKINSLGYTDELIISNYSLNM